jgi:hypothetical protein
MSGWAVQKLQTSSFKLVTAPPAPPLFHVVAGRDVWRFPDLGQGVLLKFEF